MEMRRFTPEELGRYNGKDGAPVFIACNGRVYDVSGSYFWRTGRHQIVHNAGHDLTAEMAQAPHGEDLLARFPVVGTF